MPLRCTTTAHRKSCEVTLLWVLRAGRHTKDDAYQFVSGIARSTARLVVLVTHMDRLFEERYREAGPIWRHLEQKKRKKVTMRSVFIMFISLKYFEAFYTTRGDTILQGVPHRDPRWKEQRRLLMQAVRTHV